MSATFNLCNLPYLPMKNALQNMSILDLTKISKDSTKLQNFVKFERVKTGGLDVYMSEYSWNTKEAGTMSICDVSENTSLDYRSNHQQLLKSWISSTEKIAQLFPTTLRTFQVTPPMIAAILDLETAIPKTCDVLIIQNYVPAEMDRYQESVDQFMEKCHIREGVVLHHEVYTNSPKMFQLDYLSVTHSDWMVPSDLEEMENKIVYLDKSDFYDSDMNQFLRELKSGSSHSRLQILSIQGNSWQNYWDPSDVLEGLNAELWNQTERNQHYFLNAEHRKNFKKIADHFYPDQEDGFGAELEHGVDLSEAFDFLKNDGTRVSVRFDELILQVFVWPNEKPSRKRKAQEQGSIAKRFC